MAAPSSTSLEVVHAYRRLLRAGYKAVQYSGPARYIVRDHIRGAFRGTNRPLHPPSLSIPAASSKKDGTMTFDAGVAKRTAWFLEAAGRDKGVEHKVVKNLVKVSLERGGPASMVWKSRYLASLNPKGLDRARGAYDHFDMTVAMMNKTLGIALR